MKSIIIEAAKEVLISLAIKAVKKAITTIAK